MKSFKFKVHENNYHVTLLSHEGNTIELEVNGTKYEVQLKEEVKTTKTPTLVRSASKRPVEPLKDRLVQLEAMKMENNITSEKAGKITAVLVSVGQKVLQNEVMIELE